MKKTITILFVILVLGGTLAQNHSPKTYDMSTETQIADKDQSNDIVLARGVSERLITTSVIVGEVIILLLVLFYWKKTRDDSKLGVNNTYKRNIKAIRDERVKPLLNKKNSLQRKSLMAQLKNNSLNGKTLTRTAKKLSIAKGELFLAARIQKLESQTR